MKTKKNLLAISLLLSVSICLSQNNNIETSCCENNNKEHLYTIVEDMPVFDYGNKTTFKQCLKDTLVYPFSAYKQKIEGKVYVQFVVDKNGGIKNILIVRKSNCMALNYEAIRAIQSIGKYWRAGKHRNIPVDVHQTICVNFLLSDNLKVGENYEGKNYDKLIDDIIKNSSEPNCNKNKNNIIDEFLNYTKKDGWYYYNGFDKYFSSKVANVNIKDSAESIFLVFDNCIFPNKDISKKGNAKKEIEHLIDKDINKYVNIVGIKVLGKKIYLANKRVKIGDNVDLSYNLVSTKKELTRIIAK